MKKTILFFLMMVSASVGFAKGSTLNCEGTITSKKGSMQAAIQIRHDRAPYDLVSIRTESGLDMVTITDARKSTIIFNHVGENQHIRNKISFVNSKWSDAHTVLKLESVDLNAGVRSSGLFNCVKTH